MHKFLSLSIIKLDILKKYTAFTLAEVLITLAIIGIVAAITIPSLSNSMKKQDTVAKVKKAYSVLSQATQEINAECGGSVSNCLTDSKASSNDPITRKEVADLYKAKLQVNKECLTSATLGCFGDVVYKQLDNADWTTRNLATASWLDNARLGLTDGVSVGFDWNGGVWGSYTTNLFNVYVDINGIKPPNQLGRDLFQFYYDTALNGLKPYGDGNGCTLASSGTTCAAKILRNGEMNY